MPLHLLGKKSWNVYNADNIAKVRRDEADAQAREKREEQRWQEADAERRLQLLRGHEVEDTAIPEDEVKEQPEQSATGQPRKRRRLAGEDDTDRDIRLAKEQAVAIVAPLPQQRQSLGPLFDRDGHIDLVPPQSKSTKVRDTGSGKDNREKPEDQLKFRLRDAAGTTAGADKPWYTAPSNGELVKQDVVSKDVWGNADPRRQMREQQRTSASDPLAMMKKGVKQLREAERHRKDWMDQREKDLHEVEELARLHKRRRGRQEDEDCLEEFDLDKGYSKADAPETRPSHEHKHRRKRSSHHHADTRERVRSSRQQTDRHPHRRD